MSEEKKSDLDKITIKNDVLKKYFPKSYTPKQMEDTIYKAVLNCYAIEGRYPATIDYVEQHYGLQIDHDRYDVFYEIFAENVMPEITVIEKN